MLGAKALARAKINIFLKVGPRRADGYHDLVSVMQTIELADELYFRHTDGSDGRVLIRCSDKGVPVGEDNLVWRAVEVFSSRAGVMAEGGIEVFINKRIPIGAGLAGGSADAAATLMAMDRIWELGLPLEELMQMAAEVGSDVPFCLVGGTALARGRGEEVTRLKTLPGVTVVLGLSGEQQSTAEAYRRFDELDSEDLPAEEQMNDTLERILESIERSDIVEAGVSLHNSLEFATIARARIQEYKDAAVGAGASAALMTGSGPAVFALVAGLEEASGVAREMGRLFPVTIITNFSDRGAEIAV